VGIRTAAGRATADMFLCFYPSSKKRTNAEFPYFPRVIGAHNRNWRGSVAMELRLLEANPAREGGTPPARKLPLTKTRTSPELLPPPFHTWTSSIVRQES